MKSSSVLILGLGLLIAAPSAHARRAPFHHKKHHKITRVNLGEAPRHHAAVHRNPSVPKAHFAAPPPPSPGPTPHAIIGLPLPPDEAPATAVAAPAKIVPITASPAPRLAAPAPNPAPAGESLAAAIPAPKATSSIHPIILPAPSTTPSVLVASGTITSAPSTVAPARVRITTPRPEPPAKAAPTPRPAPAPAIAAPPPAPAPKPYVLPGHALPLDTELKLINGLQAAPGGAHLPLGAAMDDHHIEVGVSGTGVFTPAVSGQSQPRESASTSGGALVTFDANPSRWLNFQFNYQYSHLTETFSNPSMGQTLASVPTAMQEFSLEYILAKPPSITSTKQWRPYVGLGGGLLHFSASSPFSAQTRGAYLVDPGVQIPTRNQHISFHVDARILSYRAPNFKDPNLANSGWATTIEPTAGVTFHF